MENTSTQFKCLTVTKVLVNTFDGPSIGSIKGLANIELNDQFYIRGLRILDGAYGLFVGYPGDDFRTICSPMTRELREHIENVVLEKYHEIKNK